MGVSPSRVNKWEHGVTPDLRHAQRLAKIFDCHVTEIRADALEIADVPPHVERAVEFVRNAPPDLQERMVEAIHSIVMEGLNEAAVKKTA